MSDFDPTKDRPMPPIDEATGRTYHGLADVYPMNKEGFVEDQASHASWYRYEGISKDSEWHLADGTLLELWPGGMIFNEWGTLVGQLHLEHYGQLQDPESTDERTLRDVTPDARYLVSADDTLVPRIGPKIAERARRWRRRSRG